MSNADERTRVVELDKALQGEGLRAAKALEELIELLNSTQPGVVSAAAHAVRRALSKLKRAAKAASNPAVEDYIIDQEQRYVQGLAEALLSNTSCVGEDSDDLRAVLVCAAVTSDEAWKKIVFASASLGRVRELKHLLMRYADLRILALQVVLDSHARGVTELSAKYKLSTSNGCELLKLCSDGDPEHNSVRHTSEVAGPVAGSKRRRTGESGHGAECHKLANGKLLRKAIGDAWLSVLSDQTLSTEQLRELLVWVPRYVIPKMANPLQLSDFLTSAYNNSWDDTSTAIIALDGLFALISNHKLDYPLFYPKLYALLSPEALFFAHGRERFLHLVGNFLSKGAYLPRGMVAAFVKRLVRRALTAPPVGTLWCLRLSLELIQKHPSVSFLVHKSVNLFEAAPGGSLEVGGPDPFDDSALDPQRSGADRSSLWELETLRNHMCPAVARLADAFGKDYRKTSLPPAELSDHAAWTFEDLFVSEFKRSTKTVPLAYDSPDPQRPSAGSTLSEFISWSG
jgi:hypothetical protein